MMNNWKMFLALLKSVPKLKIFSVITLAVIFYSLIYFLCQNSLELKAYDFLANITANKNPSNKIVIVNIDDQSLNKIGRWPWKRTYYTDIFEYLEKEAGAKAVVFDSFIFSYLNTDDDLQFFNRINKLNKIILGTFFAKKEDYFNLDFEKKVNKNFRKFYSLDINDKRHKNIINNSKYFSSSYSLPELVKENISFGSVLTEPDSDGIIRKFEPVIYFGDSYYPSLSLSLYSMINGCNKFSFSSDSLKSDGKCDIKVPLTTTNKSSYMYLKWYKNDDNKAPYKTYSAWKIINSFNQIKKGEKPLVNPKIFKDKIVVVGATSTVLKDVKSTPMGRDYPGVYVQATSLNNLINHDFVVKPFIVNIIVVFLTLIICFAAVFLLSPLYSSIFIALLSMIYFQACFICYLNNYAIDIITAPVFAVSSLTIGYGIKYFLENNQKKQIQNIMSKYMSDDIMNNILIDKNDVQLGGKRSEITVLFADIRKFTSISESLEPEQVCAILNLYFSEMIPIITKNKGVLNKFMGDALLAVFGSEKDSEDHSLNAVRCAWEMLEKVKELQKKWINEGKPKIEIGIGINTGIAFIGNIGSEERMEYTVIGDTVNIASRLESFNKVYNTKLLISQYTYEKVQEYFDVIQISSVYVKGKSETLNIYEVIGVLNSDKTLC